LSFWAANTTGARAALNGDLTNLTLNEIHGAIAVLAPTRESEDRPSPRRLCRPVVTG